MGNDVEKDKKAHDQELKESMESRLDVALKAREKRIKAKKDVDDLIKKEADAKKAVKDAREARKKAEENQKALENETSVIKNLAGYKKEAPTTRKILAGFWLFKMIYKFDTDANNEIPADAEFHKKLNQLRADDIGKAVFECSSYYKDTDTIRIDGKKLRTKINKLLVQKEEDIKSAEKFLNDKFKELYPEDKVEDNGK